MTAHCFRDDNDENHQNQQNLFLPGVWLSSHVNTNTITVGYLVTNPTKWRGVH
jgi:hypothetical protein